MVRISRDDRRNGSVKPASELTDAYASNELTRFREQSSVLHVTRDDRNNCESNRPKIGVICLQA